MTKTNAFARRHDEAISLVPVKFYKIYKIAAFRFAAFAMTGFLEK